MIRLENESLIAEIEEKGGEMRRLYSKACGREYLWTADPAVWPRHAPVLFPFVGRCKNNRYHYRGKAYSMGQHGFARDLRFMVTDEAPGTVTLSLLYSEETLKVYPFQFELRITYTLREACVEVGYQVRNLDLTDVMYFSIGGHPGFLLPSDQNNYIEFEKEEKLNRLILSKNGQFLRKFQPYLQGSNRIELTPGLFDHDALVFKDLKSQFIQLKSTETPRSVRVDLGGFPYVGIWAVPGAPFVCIEPWFGLADFEDFEGELPEKEGIQKLLGGDCFDCRYTIQLH